MNISLEVYELIYKMYRLSIYNQINPQFEFPEDISFVEKCAIKSAVVSIQTIFDVAKEVGL